MMTENDQQRPSSEEFKCSWVGRSLRMAQERTVERIHEFLSESMLSPIFVHVGKHPIKYICVVLSISIGFPLIAYLTDSFRFESDSKYLVPKESYPVVQKNWVKNTFVTSRPTYVLLHASGENVAVEEGVRRMWETEKRLWNVIQESQSIVPGGICGEAPGGCQLMSATKFWANEEDFEKTVAAGGDDGVRRRLSSSKFSDGTYVDRSSIYGHFQSDEDNNIQSAQSFRTLLLLGNVFDGDWWIELSLSSAVLELNQEWEQEGSVYHLEVFNVRSAENEAEETVEADTPLVAVAILVMAFYATFALTRCGKNSKGQLLVSSHGLLGLGAAVTVMISMATGFSFCALTGQPITALSQALPFILIGIGMDDSFVLIGAFYQTNEHLELSERLRITGRLAGPSIFVTSLTDVVAFSLGSLFSTIPSVRLAGFFAASSIFIDFIYQITFFIAIMTLDQRRLDASRRDFFICCRAESSHTDSGVIRVSEQTSSEHGTEATETEGRTVKRIMHTYTKYLLHPVSKAIVLLSFCGILIMGTIGASRAVVDFEISSFMSKDSFTRQYEQAEKTYFASDEGGLRSSIYVHGVDISNPDVQESVDSFLAELFEYGYITGLPAAFWLDGFRSYVASATNASTLSLSFEEQLDEFLSIEQVYKMFGQDIVRENGTVVAFRASVNLPITELSPASDQIDLVVGQRSLSLRQPLNKANTPEGIIPMFLFNENFEFYDHFRRISGELAGSLIISTVVVGLISLLFLPHVIGAVLTVMVIGAINVELVGIVYFAGFNIDTLSMFILIMSIGLTVDYCMHIVHSYLHSLNKEFASRNKRVEFALIEIGASVFQGGFSTFLGALVLGFAQNIGEFGSATRISMPRFLLTA